MPKSLMDKLMGRRELMAYAVVGALVTGFLVDKISPDQFLSVAGMIVAFYFGQRTNGVKAK